MRTSLKQCSIVGLAALLLLLAGAAIFYRARLLFVDTAFIAFNIINYKSLAIQEMRYGSAITQMVPYFMQRWHFGIRAIGWMYSVSFNLFYFSVACIIVYKYKQYALAVLMALYYYLMVSASYFWVTNELQQAMSWMFLLFGYMLYRGNDMSRPAFFLAFFSILAFVTFFTHFVVVIPAVYLWVYLLIEKKQWPFSKKMSIVLTAILITVIVVKYAIVATRQSYDSNHLHGVTHFSLQDIIDSFSTPVVVVFAGRCLTNYWLGVIVFILGIASLFREQQKALALWSILSVLGYIIIMGLTYGNLDKNVRLFHIESEWQSIGIIFATPFVLSFLPKVKFSLAPWIIAGIFLIRLLYIGSSLPDFQWRIKFHEHVLTQMRKKGLYKVVLYEKRPLLDKCMVEWALTYETLISSALNGERPQRTFFFVNGDDKAKIKMVTELKWFYDVWGMLPPDRLNADYFAIDTSHSYKLMTYEELFK